jgi:hypothetical protein
MVIDMKKRKLFPSFFQNDENCIQEIQDFGHVENIEDETHSRITVIEVIAR